MGYYEDTFLPEQNARRANETELDYWKRIAGEESARRKELETDRDEWRTRALAKGQKLSTQAAYEYVAERAYNLLTLFVDTHPRTDDLWYEADRLAEDLRDLLY